MSDEGFDENTLEFGESHLGKVEEEEDHVVENARQTMALISSNKHNQKHCQIDRLSVLPDSVLVHILSFLYIIQAGRTSVLSKRWKFLWAELPKLEFSDSINSDFEKTCNFVSLVSRTLGFRKWNYLKELRVNFMYYECFASDVDTWIEFSVKNEVKEFWLILFSRTKYNSYTLPQIIYSSSSFTTLRFTKCNMTFERKIEWQSLTRLYLVDVELDQRLIDEIISSSPVLYDLELERCWGFSRLEINSRSLNFFTVEESDYNDYMEISAPYVHNLDIVVFVEEMTCQFKDISSVASASINFYEFDYGPTVEGMNNAKEFLENVSHVKKLLLYRDCFEILSIMVLNGWQLPQSRVQHLALASCSEYKHAIFGIIGLLESSPNLETLRLDGYETEGIQMVNHYSHWPGFYLGGRLPWKRWRL